MRRARRVLRGLIFALAALLLAGNIYTAVAKNVLGKKSPTVFGFSSSVVLTGSMSGAIEPNDLIITRRQSDYTVGDIITFSSGTSSVTHRIISADGEGYRTKGDANNTADALPVIKSDVIGKVVLIIPKIGAFIGFVQTPAGFLSFLALLVIITELPSAVNYFKKRKETN